MVPSARKTNDDWPSPQSGSANSAARGAERAAGAAVVGVEVPPTGPVGDVVQTAVRAPPRLRDRLAPGSGHEARRPQVRVAVDRRHPQLGAVPRHVGVVPAQPRHLGAVGAEARRGEEVVSPDETVRFAGFGCDGRDIVDDVAVVRFPHRDQPPPVRRQRRGRRSGRRQARAVRASAAPGLRRLPRGRCAGR